MAREKTPVLVAVMVGIALIASACGAAVEGRAGATFSSYVCTGEWNKIGVVVEDEIQHVPWDSGVHVCIDTNVLYVKNAQGKPTPGQDVAFVGNAKTCKDLSGAACVLHYNFGADQSDYFDSTIPNLRHEWHFPGTDYPWSAGDVGKQYVLVTWVTDCRFPDGSACELESGNVRDVNINDSTRLIIKS